MNAPINPNNSLYLDRPIVQLEGTNIPLKLAKDFIEVVVEESLHKPSTFTIKIHNVYGQANKNSKPWERYKDFKKKKRISIGFAASNTKDSEYDEAKIVKQLIEGEITGFRTKFTEQKEAHIVIYGKDVSHQLYRGRNTYSFTHDTDTEIVQKVVNKNVGIETGQLDESGQTNYHVFQQNQTNIDFLRERAAKVGFEFFVRDNKIYFREPQSEGSLELAWPEDIVSIDVKVDSAEQVSSVRVNSWDYKRKELISETASKEQSVTETGHGKGSISAQEFEMKQFPEDIVVDRPVDSVEEARQLAQARCDELSGEYVNADAKAVGNPQIRPGKVIELTNLGPRYSGKYYITGTRHRYIGKKYMTYFTVRGLRESLFSTVSPKTHLQPSQTLMIGTVSNNNDPENLGRVKVKIETMSKEHETDWARVLAGGAGNERGFYWLPEIFDEVLVGFEHGDIRRPIILGGLWNGKDKPVETIDNTLKKGQVNQRTIKSRTGHMIQFVEEDHGESEAGVYVTSEGDQCVHLNDSEQCIDIETSGRINLSAEGETSVGVGLEGLELPSSVNISGILPVNISSTTGGVKVSSTIGKVNIESTVGGVDIESDVGSINIVTGIGKGINLVSSTNITMVAPTITMAAPVITTQVPVMPNYAAATAAATAAGIEMAATKAV